MATTPTGVVLGVGLPTLPFPPEFPFTFEMSNRGFLRVLAAGVFWNLWSEAGSAPEISFDSTRRSANRTVFFLFNGWNDSYNAFG